jgi:hypothetical protein
LHGAGKRLEKLSASSAGANRKPWNSLQPAASRKARCGSVSTPSATTCRRIACAICTMARTSAASLLSAGRPWMKLRSIFRRWIGQRFR